MEEGLPRADPETAYEADMMILDELIFRAITALLEEYTLTSEDTLDGNAKSLPADLSLELVKSTESHVNSTRIPDLTLNSIHPTLPRESWTRYALPRKRQLSPSLADICRRLRPSIR
jgi:hypothetical protein